MGNSNTGNHKPAFGGVQKKRILLVVRWPVGGIRTFLRYVYRSFGPELYHFCVLGPDNAELDILADDLEGLDLEIVKVSKCPSSKELLLAVASQLMRGNYDLVHSHGFTSGICSALPASFLRIPHILTSHDVLGHAQFKGAAGWMKKSAMRIAFSLIDNIHSVSHDAQANLLEFFPTLAESHGKCIVITNGIETDRFLTAMPRDLRTELDAGSDAFLIGFLGRFMSQKGFLYLVDAIEDLTRSGKLPKRPLVLCFGEGGFVREEKAALAKRGLEGYFRFLPFTANVAGVIKGLDLVVMPSLWEACGLVAMETLVAGTPLIASNCIGLREVTLDTPTYVIPSKDSKALEEGIKLFMNQDMRQPFTDFSPQAAAMFDVRVTVSSIQKLVKKSFREVSRV